MYRVSASNHVDSTDPDISRSRINAFVTTYIRTEVDLT